MVGTKKVCPLGFGSSVPRFDKMFLHAKLDPTGLFTSRSLGCDPCLYHPQSIHMAYENMRKKSINKDVWRYKSELEDWSKNLGYRNQKVLERRRWFASLLGPAWTEVPDPVKHDVGVCKNVLFGRTRRFKTRYLATPAPGTYHRSEPYKAPYGPHSSRPTFEREEACRFPERSKGYALAPNRYNIIDKSSIENKSKTIVSRRGPYDLFTGKRDMSTIKNHFSLGGRPQCKTWPVMLPGCFEELKKKHLGVWNKTNRDLPSRSRSALIDQAMAPRKASDPSPATYDVVKGYKFRQNKRGFNSSYDKGPLYVRQVVWPGVGRYTIPSGNLCGLIGHGHKHVFLCKTERTVGAILPQPMNSF